MDDVSGNPTTWMPQVLSDGSGFSTVNTVLKFRSTLYVGGYFFSAQGYSSSYFAGLIDTEVTSVEQETSPPAPSLLQAAPNPFRASTVARFALPRADFADVSVYDVGGRRVRQLHLGLLAAGEHALPWEGSNDRGNRTPAGVYFLRVSTPSVDQSVKLLRLR